MGRASDDAELAKSMAIIDERGVQVADRRHQAHSLRIAGVSWAKIAAQLGFRDEKHAFNEVQIYYQQAAVNLSTQKKEQALQEALGALDELQAAHWPAAIAGDDKSANIVLRCIAQKGKFQGLESITSESVTQQLILIQGHEKDYVARLREMVEQKAKPKVMGNDT